MNYEEYAQEYDWLGEALRAREVWERAIDDEARAHGEHFFFWAMLNFLAWGAK